MLDLGFMRQNLPTTLLILLASLCAQAQAGVFISTQFLGTPRESSLPGARTMPGWGSGVPVLYSDGGPILSVDFGGTAAGGEPYGIYGALGQRWQSSQSNGAYDITTPGPINVYNAQSTLSFDSALYQQQRPHLHHRADGREHSVSRLEPDPFNS